MRRLIQSLVVPKTYRPFLDWHLKRFGKAPQKLGFLVDVFLNAFRKTKRVRLWRAGGGPPLWLRPEGSDRQVFDQVFIEEEYEFEVPEPRLIVDAGANTGFSAVYFSDRFPSARVIALEPDESNFNLLLLNGKNRPNLECRHQAVWDSCTKLTVVDGCADSWAFQFVEGDERGHVEAVSIDSILDGEECDSGVMLKIDIEGGEKVVFSSSMKWIQAVDSIFVECHDRFLEGCSDAVLSAVGDEDFQKHQSGENMVFIRGGART